jgi:predicted nucleotide-binding protein (sugar kinase/HSP70/actin superfamily)
MMDENEESRSMRITFPHMGNIWVAVKAMANQLGVDLVIPPPTSQRTLSLGIRYSPETACLPFKLTLGNMIEALELGADTIVMTGQYGPCRFGYYHKVQELILRELGYDFQLVKESLGIRSMVRYLTNGASLREIVSGFRFGLAKLKALDEVEQHVYRIRAIEQEKGNATCIYTGYIKAIDDAGDYEAIKRAKQEHIQKLMRLPTVSSPDVLKIGVTGEFFLVIDPFATMDIEIELGKLGAEVKRPQSVWELVNFNPFIIVFRLKEKNKSRKAAMPYLSHHVGGDGQQSVGEKVLHTRHWDGLVHLEPFGCLPEIMARNIMPWTNEELPVLNIVFDEHTGKAGMINRLEAFTDMIRRRKR